MYRTQTERYKDMYRRIQNPDGELRRCVQKDRDNRVTGREGKENSMVREWERRLV